MAYRLLTSAMLAACTLIVPASPPQIPLEPVNWEADADPRFDPRVEQVVVDRAQIRARQDEATDIALWEDWGLEAMEPLRRILDEPRWENPFRSQALDLMYACPLAGAEAVLAEELGRRAASGAKDDDRAIKAYRIHLYAAVRRYPDLLKPLLTHENVEIRYFAAEVLIQHRKQIPEEVVPVIEALAASDDRQARFRAINLLSMAPSKENNARALEIAATISETAVTQTKAGQERNAPRERAQEPMKLILEKENNR